MPRICLPLLAALAFLSALPSAHARPAHKKALADHLGVLLPKHLNDCRTCHLPDVPGEKLGENEKPHNAFGARLAALRKELRQAGKSDDIAARLNAAAQEDADGDGVPNLLEILGGRNPGEAKDTPKAEELTRARRLLTAYQNRQPYAWKPFEAVRRPDAPRVKSQNWVRNPIDAFLAQQHELFGLTPRPEAPREILLRRVYLDLIGLAPTPAQIDAFLQDPAADAYEKVVDELLARPQHGQRWARHWMDVWRYTDFSNSALQDGWEGAPHMWRWRDWIVDALNSDKGYDRMLQEMLAGDELAPEDPAVLVATGFLARNKNRARDAWLHDIVNHSSRAFLGVTMECARCHDHKYDPIGQVEYYRIRAIFEPHSVRIDPAPQPDGDKKDKSKSGVTRVVDSNSAARTFFYIRGVEQNPDKNVVIEPGVPELAGKEGFKVEPVKLTVSSGKTFTSTGRRLAFARWLTRPENPLAARVAVNHVWLRHFGQALVPSTFNFGADGLPPTHPALLDWLAAEFMQPTVASGERNTAGAKAWSLRHLHRLIVTSSAYRMSSTPDAANLAFDPENQFLWRMPLRRLEAELVRDNLLAAAGNLDPAAGGPELDPKRGLDIKRRSIYFRYTDSDFLRVLEFFDPPGVEDCYYRPSSILPQQALTLLNSELALTQARLLARKLDEEARDDAPRFVQSAFRHVLARSCTAAEEKTCLDYLTEQTTFFERNKGKLSGTSQRTDTRRGAAEPALRARENLVHLLFSHQDFVMVR